MEKRGMRRKATSIEGMAEKAKDLAKKVKSENGGWLNLAANGGFP
jgi:hypothetical protein